MFLESGLGFFHDEIRTIVNPDGSKGLFFCTEHYSVRSPEEDLILNFYLLKAYAVQVILLGVALFDQIFAQIKGKIPRDDSFPAGGHTTQNCLNEPY